MSHTLKMLIGCLAPLLLIFALPVFGVSETVSVWAVRDPHVRLPPAHDARRPWKP